MPVEFDAFAFAEEILRPTKESIAQHETPAALEELEKLQDAITKTLRHVQNGPSFEKREVARLILAKTLRDQRTVVIRCVADGEERTLVSQETAEALRATSAVAMAFL
jgi:hypothetical protein